MKDAREDLTMQQRKNTLYYVPWSTSERSSIELLSSLIQLETETNSGKYDNNQTYKMGETIFG